MALAYLIHVCGGLIDGFSMEELDYIAFLSLPFEIYIYIFCCWFIIHIILCAYCGMLFMIIIITSIYTSGSCVAAGHTNCSGSVAIGGCYCDLICYSARDCCSDIAQTCQPRKCLYVNVDTLDVSQAVHVDTVKAV